MASVSGSHSAILAARPILPAAVPDKVWAIQTTTMQSFCDLETPQQERLRLGAPESAPADSWLGKLAEMLGPAPID